MNKTMIATTIEQSKDLLRLGLSPDTADMYYPKVDEGLYATCPYPKECAAFRKQESDIPVWSLSALLKVMSKDMKGIPEKKTPIDAAYNMVAWLLENGHIKTENTSPIKNAERVVMTPEQMKAFEESQYKNGWKDIGWGLKRDRNGNIAGGLKRK